MHSPSHCVISLRRTDTEQQDMHAFLHMSDSGPHEPIAEPFGAFVRSGGA
jgi:hypothetical protein